MPLVPKEFKDQYVPVALSDGELPEKYKTADVSEEDSKDKDNV